MARSLIGQVNSAGPILRDWSLGGGTALMLRLNHRESRDIDIFLSDAQHLSFLDPAKRDFRFEIPPNGQHGDGARFLKPAFANLGEIDFIVAATLTRSPATNEPVEGELLSLETVPEVIAKKIYHRGSALKPRDVFDIAASGVTHADDLVRELRNYPHEVATAMSGLDKLNPAFVRSAISQLAIKPSFEMSSRTALERTKEILRAVLA